MSAQFHIVHEPYSDKQQRVVIAYEGTKQVVKVLIAKGENAVGETNWVPASTPEEYQAVIEAWAKKSYQDYTDRMDRENPRGGPGDW